MTKVKACKHLSMDYNKRKYIELEMALIQYLCRFIHETCNTPKLNCYICDEPKWLASTYEYFSLQLNNVYTVSVMQWYWRIDNACYKPYVHTVYVHLNALLVGKWDRRKRERGKKDEQPIWSPKVSRNDGNDLHMLVCFHVTGNFWIPLFLDRLISH